MTEALNGAAFFDRQSRLRALGANLDPNQTIVDQHGATIGYLQSGGMISPQRHEVAEATTLFRFGGTAGVEAVVAGGWWLERASFDRILSFSEHHGIPIGLAARLLCLVPPEWSDMGRLVKVRTARPLLAWRGLGNTVVVPKSDGLGAVVLPEQNEIASRRVHQLYIPGMNQPGAARRAFSIEGDWALDPEAGKRGWIYLG